MNERDPTSSKPHSCSNHERGLHVSASRTTSAILDCHIQYTYCHEGGDLTIPCYTRLLHLDLDSMAKRWSDEVLHRRRFPFPILEHDVSGFHETEEKETKVSTLDVRAFVHTALMQADRNRCRRRLRVTLPDKGCESILIPLLCVQTHDVR